MPEKTRKRAPGGGRKPKHGTVMPHQIGVRATAEAAHTLRQYNQSEAIHLLASGLALGAGNAPELTADEVAVLRSVLAGAVVDALFIRHLADEVAASDHPAAAGLLAKLRQSQVGDWELLHLALRWE